MREKEFLPLVRQRLGIEELNAMQRQMLEAVAKPGDVMLLSPTGSGKTLAFLLFLLKLLKAPCQRVQAVLIAPTRELVQQIYSVARQLVPGYKVTVLYGGHDTGDEEASLNVTPDIVIATPGRLLDHSKRGNIELLDVSYLVLDEFDKALELGFEKDMARIVGRMKNLSRLVLTSATPLASLPDFIRPKDLRRFDYLGEGKELRRRLRVHRVDSDVRDKLDTLRRLLLELMPTGAERTIIFVNYRESAERVAESLRKLGADPGLYTGALDQHDREKALALFNNGTRPLLVTTDLASRGLDISDVRNIIHYHQPLTAESYTHRNGRTARVDATGDAFVLIGPDEDVKEYIQFDDTRYLGDNPDGRIPASPVATLYISAGRKEKISRGDVVGFLVNQGSLPAKEIGAIDLHDHYTLVAIPRIEAKRLIVDIAPLKIKGRKPKYSIVK